VVLVFVPLVVAIITLIADGQRARARIGGIPLAWQAWPIDGDRVHANIGGNPLLPDTLAEMVGAK
jgi:hypothetical protein